MSKSIHMPTEQQVLDALASLYEFEAAGLAETEIHGHRAIEVRNKIGGHDITWQTTQDRLDLLVEQGLVHRCMPKGARHPRYRRVGY